MFFVTKSGTRKRVTEGMRPMIGMIEMTGGIPTGFWEDPTVLGYLTGCISGLIFWSSNDKYRDAVAGDITIGVLIDLIGTRNGMTVSKRNVALLHDEVYEKAAKAGLLAVIVLRHGPERVIDQAIVVEAIEHGKKMRAIAESVLDTVSDQASIRDLVYSKRAENLIGAVPYRVAVSNAIQDMVYRSRVEALRAPRAPST